jgi:hypothetical protein
MSPLLQGRRMSQNFGKPFTRLATCFLCVCVCVCVCGGEDQLVSEHPLESPPEVEWPIVVIPFSHWRRSPTSEHAHVYGRTKTLITDPDGTRNQELLCRRGPAAVYPTDRPRTMAQGRLEILKATRTVREWSVVTGVVGLWTKNPCAGEDQQQFSSQAVNLLADWKENLPCICFKHILFFPLIYSTESWPSVEWETV